MHGLLRRAGGDIGEFTPPGVLSELQLFKGECVIIAGMCENAIMSSEFQFRVFWMG